jgi:sugar phosphate isomerase/epimerase
MHRQRESGRGSGSTRRGFLAALGGWSAFAAFRAGAPSGREIKEKRLPIAFSTLACPTWSLAKILDFAEQHSFAAIELRGLEGSMDLPSHPAFAPGAIEGTKKEIAVHGLKIACVSSSARMGEEDAEKRGKELGDARRFVDLASTLGAPYVRVFGGGKEEPDGKPGEALKARVASGLHELGEYAGPKNVTVIIESHDNFTSSTALRDVLTQAASPHVALLWDAHHTFATGGEEPEYTVKQLGPWIRHTHLKDSTGSEKDRKYVLTGRGNVPIERQIRALQGTGYPGFYCFEWEKVWHPDLEDPEIAIADYARVVSGMLRQ